MIGVAGASSCAGYRMNGRVCGPPRPPWKQMKLLEGAALAELGVVEAADHDVGDVREAVGTQQVSGRSGGERRERVLPVDAALVEVVRAASAERDGPVLGGVHEQPADVRVLAQYAQEYLGGARRSPRASAGAAPPSGRRARGCRSRARRRRGRRHRTSTPASASPSPRLRRDRPWNAARPRPRCPPPRPRTASARPARRGRSRCAA